jgi:hypothetical protein
MTTAANEHYLQSDFVCRKFIEDLADAITKAWKKLQQPGKPMAQGLFMYFVCLFKTVTRMSASK